MPARASACVTAEGQGKGGKGPSSPSKVAVQAPHASIARGVELDGEVARARGHELRVAALRVRGPDDGAVPPARADGEDLEVVPVQVDGVGHGVGVGEDEADGGVGAKVEDVAGLVGGEPALEDVVEDGAGVVGEEGLAVDLVDDVGAVAGHGDVEGLGGGRVGRGDLVDGLGGGEGVVVAGGGRAGGVGRAGGFAGRELVCVGAVVVDGREGLVVGPVRDAAAGDGAAHPVGVARLAGGGDEHVGALAHREGDHVGRVGRDLDKVVGDHLHLVAVDGEFLDRARARVDQPEAVHFGSGKGELRVARVVLAGFALGGFGARV